MNNKYKEEILTVFKSIKDSKSLDAFLRDILTPNEYEEIVKRWQVVKQLSKGIPQRQIATNLKISLAKITRGSRVLLNKKGAFNQLLKNKK
jgi:TrpR family trp operon transcriptional repressor